MIWEERELAQIRERHQVEIKDLRVRQITEAKALQKKVSAAKRKQRDEIWKEYLVQQLPHLAEKVQTLHAKGAPETWIKSTLDLPHVGRIKSELAWITGFNDKKYYLYLDLDPLSPNPDHPVRLTVAKWAQGSKKPHEQLNELLSEIQKGNLPPCAIWQNRKSLNA